MFLIFQFSSGFEETEESQRESINERVSTPDQQAKHYLALCAVAQGVSQGVLQGVSQGGAQGGASSGAARTKASRERERQSLGPVAYNIKEA